MNANNPLQDSCLENPRDRGAWRAAVYGVAQSDMTEVTQQQQQHSTFNVYSLGTDFVSEFSFYPLYHFRQTPSAWNLIYQKY